MRFIYVELCPFRAHYRQLVFIFFFNSIFSLLKMDENGWIPLAMVASFRRIQRLTQNLSMILEVGVKIV